MRTEQPDFYAILDVPRTASQTEIASAYRRLVREHHPDHKVWERHPDTQPADPVALEQVVAAYTVLRDPDRRAAYDRQQGASHRSPSRKVIRVEPGDSSPVPPIRVGPVRYHGPPAVP